MKEFDVTITETLQRTVTVRAEDRAEAEEIVQESWNSEEYVLDSGDFVEADFKADEGHEIVPTTLSALLGHTMLVRNNPDRSLQEKMPPLPLPEWLEPELD